MKKQVFFIHGGSAYSNYNSFLEVLRTRPLRDLPGTEPMKKWSGTFKDDLGDELEVFAPSMPNSQNAKYLEWKIWFERYFEYIKDELVLIGWSQGGYFLAKYLIENQTPFTIKALLLLAAPFEAVPGDPEDGGDFAFDTKRVGELAKKVPKIVIMHSQDDFVVPYEHALQYKKALPQAELVTYTDKNHFLITEFDDLIFKIKDIS
jgi:predicted alpha/beta hydrolase family esterase